MKKQFKNIESITDRKTYDAAMAYMNELIDYATRKGYLSNPENDNEYTREIGRVGIMCADYESIYMKFKNLKVKLDTAQKMSDEQLLDTVKKHFGE